MNTLIQVGDMVKVTVRCKHWHINSIGKIGYVVRGVSERDIAIMEGYAKYVVGLKRPYVIVYFDVDFGGYTLSLDPRQITRVVWCTRRERWALPGVAVLE